MTPNRSYLRVPTLHLRIFSTQLGNAVASIVVMLSLFTCRGELDGLSIVEFTTTDQSLTEGDSLRVLLSIKGNRFQDDTVTINIEQPLISIAANPPIENNRIKVLVRSVQKLVEIKIIAIDNGRLEGDRSVKLSLNNPGPRLRAGTLANLTILVRDDEALSTAEFALAEASFREGESEGLLVQIPLSMPLEGEGIGILRISITSTNAIYGVHYTTLPEAVNGVIGLVVGAGASTMSFEVRVIDNDRLDGQLSLTFKIEGGFGSIGMGNKLSFLLTLFDDELPSSVNFGSNSLVVDEDNPDGITVDIYLDPPASGEGTFSIGFLQSEMYGRDFSTEPSAGSDKTIFFSVSKGDDHLSFKLFPVNDLECRPKWLFLNIPKVSGVLLPGPTTSVFIRDDESPVASLSGTSGSVLESSTSGIAIQITLSKPTPSIDVVDIYFDPTPYGNRFLTNPPAVTQDINFPEEGFRLSVVFSPGSTSAEFKVYPIDNFLKENNYEVEFLLQEKLLGCIVVPESKVFKLTILDED